MLILTRRAGESLRIGDDVILNVLEMGGGQVRIGVTAPKHISVHREEIYERIQRGEPLAPKAPIPVAAPVAAQPFVKPEVVQINEVKSVESKKPSVQITVKRRIGLN